MPRRSKEGDVLQQKTATLNQTISTQMEPVVFGDTMSSANFITDQLVKNAISKGDSDYGKVSTMMSAVKDHITSQSTPEKVTQKFNEFVLLLYNDFKLDDFAQQLVKKLREVKPGYVSPLDEVEEATPSAEQQQAHSGFTTASTTRTQPQPQPQARQQPETPVREVTSSEVQTNNTRMTVDQLYSWLLSNNMPPEDCEIFREKKINGASFRHCSEEEWKSFGISFGGSIILKKCIMNQVSSSANPDHLNGSSSNGSANGSTNGSSNGTTVAASPQGNSKTSGHTLVKDHHYGSLCEQLRPCAALWEDIAKALGFKSHEIANIKADPMKLMNAPGSYMDGTIEKWSHWAPGDARGSKDYATLEALRTAVDKAGISDIAFKLTLK